MNVASESSYIPDRFGGGGGDGGIRERIPRGVLLGDFQEQRRGGGGGGLTDEAQSKIKSIHQTKIKTK